MTELVASYATDRYVLRLIRPDADSLFLLLQTESPSGSSFFPRASLKDFEEAREGARAAEEIYWKSLLASAPRPDRAVVLSGWEHFRQYAGLPALIYNDEKESHGNDHPQDG